MRVLQINAVYDKFSTGRTTKELHHALIQEDIESYVATPDAPSSKSGNFYIIGSNLDRKIHSLFSRVAGLQGYFSKRATQRLIKWIEEIEPDIIHLRNLHSNYINIPLLLDYIGRHNISTVVTLHDSFFYTGKCVYYIESACDKWMHSCGNCPALHRGNPSLFIDFSKKMLSDKRKRFAAIKNLAIIGVSDWITEDAKKSILKGARIIKRIYNWIDLEVFTPNEKSENHDRKKFKILGVAMHWNEEKGIHIFHELAKILPDNCEITLIGEYKHLKELSDKIRYIPPLRDAKALANYYANSDVFLNPTMQETFGKTTAESLSCGTPVIAYRSTATPELLGNDGKCGYLTDENSAQSYLQLITEIMKRQKQDFQEQCRNRARLLFDKKTNVKAYIDLYKELTQDE